MHQLAPAPAPTSSPNRTERAHTSHWAHCPWHVRRTFTIIFVVIGLTIMAAADLDVWPSVAVVLVGNAVCITLLMRFFAIKRKHHV
jgi:antibiotic biosynthesis monooxygenase (ABM) superfamily enzyme